METPTSILALLTSGRLIDCLEIDANLSVEALLDARDAAPFADRWMEAFRAVEQGKAGIMQADAETSSRIREEVYLGAFARWNSADLAAYVSDDFGLIVDAAAAGFDDPWIVELFESYKRGTIPAALN